MQRKILGGAGLIAAGALLGRETVAWALGKALDAITAGVEGPLTLATFPWLNTLGLLLMAAGLWLILRPADKGPDDLQLERLSARMANLSSDLAQALTGGFAPRHSTFGQIVAVYVSLEKLGIATPSLEGPKEVTGRDQHTTYVHAKQFVDAIAPMIDDGHIKEAKAEAPGLIEAIGAKASVPKRRWPLSIGLKKQR